MGMKNKLVELVNVSKSFGSTKVLDELCLEVKENEFLTLLGPSGCGKTTTLRIIGGFEKPDSGKVFFDGADITNVPANKRNLNTVFQKYALFGHMTIEENIAFGLKIKNKSDSYIKDKIKYALKLVNLEGFEKRKPTSLSGGQQQRIAIARAIVNEPKVLLLDEPLGALDLKLRQDMQYELMRLKEELGITFIYITHDTQFAAMHGNADKIWIQDYDGEHWKFKKIEDNDLPEELLLDILGNRNNVLFVEGEKNSFDVQLYGALYPSYHIIPCGSCSQVIERTKVFNNNPSLHNCKVYGIIDRDYRSDYEIEKYKENNIFTLNVAEVENLFITEELIRLMAEHMGKEANTTFEEIKKYVIHTRFSHQIESQICQSVVAQIKYKLSCVDISKQNSEKAKASLETAFKSINYEQVSSNETEKFQKILSEQNYADVIKVFNEKGIAKSIGQYFNIDNSSYCTTVISLLNGSKHNDIVAALLPYFPTEIPR